jgi:homoserine dehydrogenase
VCRAVTDAPGASAELTVLKFGSSLLAGLDGYGRALEEVLREIEAGRRVVAVVSARRGVTDALERDARALSAWPDSHLRALLLRTGEEASAALLGLALGRFGVRTRVLTADELGLRTLGAPDDGEPADVDVDALRGAVERHEAVVVPGFVGRDASGRPALLGRGGSDYTALFVASRLGASEVRLVKDVDGVFPSDPRRMLADHGPDAPTGTRPTAEPGRPPPALERVSWSEVERIGNGVVQPKALRFAERIGLPFRVAGVGGRGTLVGPRCPRGEP